MSEVLFVFTALEPGDPARKWNEIWIFFFKLKIEIHRSYSKASTKTSTGSYVFPSTELQKNANFKRNLEKKPQDSKPWLIPVVLVL